MNNPKVSVIIPIFNVQKWILNGIKYILNQDYSNFEIILVDDGSTDNSGKICDEMASSHNNITVEHTENLGSGHARNIGIDMASGEYIYFFDIDDQCSNNLISTCVQRIIEAHSDMAIFSFDMIEHGNKTSITENRVPDGVVDNFDVLKEFYIKYILTTPGGNGYVWNKFYKKDFLIKHNIRFPDLRIQQDEVFNLEIYRYTPIICSINKCLYKYYIYNRGNTRSHYIPNRFEIYTSVYQAFEELHSNWNINNKEVKARNSKRLLAGAVTSLRYNLLHPNNPQTRKLKIAELKSIINHPITKKCRQLWSLSHEDRIFLSIAQLNSIALLRFYNRCMSTLRVSYRFFH